MQKHDGLTRKGEEVSFCIYKLEDKTFVWNSLLHRTRRATAPVEEYAADVIVADGGFLGAGSHAKRPEETVHQDGQLVDVLRLCFHHAEDDLVPLPHALSMRGTDVVLDNNLPLPPAEPATHEALHLHSRSTTWRLKVVHLYFVFLLIVMSQQHFTFLIFFISGSSSSWLLW